MAIPISSTALLHSPCLILLPEADINPLSVGLALGALAALPVALGAWWRTRRRALRLAKSLALFEAERSMVRELNRQLEQQIDARNSELRESLAALSEAHQQLVQAERIAALGQFSSGVAHEINNPLAFVHSNLLFLQETLRDAGRLAPPEHAHLSVLSPKEYEECQAVVRESLEGTSRIASIVADLKLLAQREEAPTGPVDVRHALELAMRLARAHLCSEPQVVHELEEMPAVDAHLGRLAQVFFSLLINASRAPEEAPGVAQQIRVRSFLRREAGEVVVEVENTGSGIPEHVRRRLFEPFFTTQPQGLGLGLSISRGIIRSFKGELEYESNEGQGSVFRVVLPAPSSGATVRAVEAQ